MPILAPFHRASVAYLTAGYRQKSGTPRFETGKFSGTKALRIEEGVTNLLSANQSSIETDVTPWNTKNSPTSISRDTTQKYEGASSMKIVHGNADGSGYTTDITTGLPANGSSVIASAWVRGDPGQTPAANSFRLILEVVYTDATTGSAQTIYTPTNTWQRIVTPALATNAAKTILRFTLYQVSNGVQNGIITYTDLLQVEVRDFATTAHVGGTPRAAETCVVPAADLFRPSEGTIEAWIYLEDNTSGTHVLVDGHQPADGFSHAARIYLSIVAGTLTFGYWNGSTNREITGGAVSLGTWTHVAAKWSSSGAAIYKNGSSQATHAEAPSLTLPPRLGIGARLDATQQLNGLLGGLRVTTRARSDAEILAAYNANVQFTEDGADATVFTFNCTTRALLTTGMHQVAPETSFLIPTSTTASTTATEYATASMTDYEFPLLPHRTTNTNQTALVFDFGEVVNIRAVMVALVNWEGFQLASSLDGATFADVVGSPFACLKDEADQYRKWGSEVAVNGRYARITLPAQLPDDQAGYFETPLVVFAADLDTLEANPNWGINFALGFDYDNTEAGGHSEVLAKGKQYLTLQVRSDGLRGAKSNEWMQLGAGGDHRKFMLLSNLGKSQECYLMRPAGGMRWEEQSGHNAISMTWREHIN